jgi:hypothetical protein
VALPRVRRRDFLAGTAATTASLALGLPLGCDDDVPPFVEATGWNAGEVAHVLSTVNDRRIRLKVSFRTRRQEPVLRVGERSSPGVGTDSGARFFAFDVAGLEANTEYELRLEQAGVALCDSWPLRTFPSRGVFPERFRLLSYTCAGGSDLFRHPLHGRLFVPTQIRRRLLARALAFGPDAVIANGDHVYWDIRSRPGLGMARSPQAWWWAGRFDREVPVLGTDNESVLKKGFGPQIADLYGTLFRSVPVFFLQDDHDYTENDEATDDLRTFPPDRFMVDVARATQRLYYPEFLSSGTLPSSLQSPGGLAENYGELRFGRLFEGLLYDCRRFLTNHLDPETAHTESRFVPPEAERWLLDRTRRGDSLHLAHVPSTPVLWTAGKWGEWYPDVTDASGVLSIDERKPYWPRGWKEQHDRLLAAASRRRDRTPLWVSGDLHATGIGQILGTGGVDLETNPIVSVLSGTPGTAGPGWPSRFRGQRPVPSLTLDAEEWVEPIEENGFTLLDFTRDGVRIAQFRWKPEDGPDAIAHLEPFFVREIPRPAQTIG